MRQTHARPAPRIVSPRVLRTRAGRQVRSPPRPGHTGERELLNLLLAPSPDLIFIKDTAGRYIRPNRADAALLGLDAPADVVGKTDFDLVSTATARAFR